MSDAPGAQSGYAGGSDVFPHARPKTSGTVAGPLTIPSLPPTTYELNIRWTDADMHTINQVASYLRLNSPSCEINEWVLPLELPRDHTVLPPVDRWNACSIPWDTELDRQKALVFLLCDRTLFQDLRAYCIRAMNGIIDLRTGHSLRSAGSTTRFTLALVPPGDLVYRICTLTQEVGSLTDQAMELRESIRHLRLQLGVRDLRLHQMRDTLGVVIESLCAMDESLVPLFHGLTLPSGPLVDPLDDQTEA